MAKLMPRDLLCKANQWMEFCHCDELHPIPPLFREAEVATGSSENLPIFEIEHVLCHS